MRRNTPHRPERETPQREQNDLKAKNKVLMRQVARLKKEIGRLEGIQDEGLDPEPMAKEEVCSACGCMTLKRFVTPSQKVLICCTSCKYRSALQGGSNEGI